MVMDASEVKGVEVEATLIQLSQHNPTAAVIGNDRSINKLTVFSK